MICEQAVRNSEEVSSRKLIMAFFTFQRSWCLFDKPGDGKKTMANKDTALMGLYHCCLPRLGLLGDGRD